MVRLTLSLVRLRKNRCVYKSLTNHTYGNDSCTKLISLVGKRKLALSICNAQDTILVVPRRYLVHNRVQGKIKNNLSVYPLITCYSLIE